MKEALSSSETSILTTAILRNIPEDAIRLLPFDSLCQQPSSQPTVEAGVVCLYRFSSRVQLLFHRCRQLYARAALH
jgi:hypothetical protein